MISLENDFMSIKVKKAGAELISVYDKNREKEKMWSQDPKYWNKVSPVLFPFIGLVKDGFYIYENEKYEMTKHGFLRDQVFDVLEQTEDTVLFSFKSNDATYKIFPFMHEVQIRYTLKMRSVQVAWEVFNHDTKQMYYSIGAHPAFKLDKGFDYYFTFPNEKRAYEVELEEGFVKGKKAVELEPLLIETEKFLNDAIVFENINGIVLQKKDSSESVRVNFKGFPYVGLWSPIVEGEMAPFVCIEPWVGIADELNSNHQIKDKLAVSYLPANKSKQYRYEMIFQ